jgi:hypothetical protein
MYKSVLEKYNGYYFNRTNPLLLFEAISRNNIADVKHALTLNNWENTETFIKEINELTSTHARNRYLIFMYAALSNNVEIVKLVHKAVGRHYDRQLTAISLLEFTRKNNLSIEIYEYFDGVSFSEDSLDFLKEPDCREDIKIFYQQKELKKKFVKILKEGSSQNFLNVINEFSQAKLSINSKFDNNKSFLEYAIEREFPDVLEVLLRDPSIDAPLSLLDLVKSDKILYILCDYFNEIGALRNFYTTDKEKSLKVINYIFDSAQKQMSSIEISNKRSRS